MSSTDNTYNGWTNFETWKIGLEILDGWNLWDVFDLGEIGEIMDEEGEDCRGLLFDTRRMIEDFVEEAVFGCDKIPAGHAKNFAEAFINAVNFHELARSKIDAAFEEVRYQRSRAA